MNSVFTYDFNMEDLETKWKRQERMRWMLISIIASIAVFVGLNVIAHEIGLVAQALNAKCV